MSSICLFFSASSAAYLYNKTDLSSEDCRRSLALRESVELILGLKVNISYVSSVLIVVLLYGKRLNSLLCLEISLGLNVHWLSIKLL